MDTSHSVLIVDRSEENREVLQTILERRGWRIWTSSRSDEGAALAEQHKPDLIVLDLEVDGKAEENFALCPSPEPCDNQETVLSASSSTDAVPMILLGTVQRRSSDASRGEFVAKPYHYAPLIRKIEELIESAPIRSQTGCFFTA